MKDVIETGQSGDADLRYEAVFLDVDGTLLWVDLDVEGYVEDLYPYYAGGNGGLTTEGRPGRCGRACGGTSGRT